jgi:hypothetical protein
MPRGRSKGSPKTPGSERKRGTPNKATALHREMLERMKVDTRDPMSFWISIMQNPAAPYEEKKWASVQLGPFCHPRLSSIEARGGGMTHEERLAEAQRLLEEAGAERRPHRARTRSADHWDHELSFLISPCPLFVNQQVPRRAAGG